MKQIWIKVKNSIKKQIQGQSFRMWIDPLDYLRSDNDSIVLTCPNAFSKKRILNYYSALIESELHKVSGNGCKFIIEISKNNGCSRKKTREKNQIMNLRCLFQTLTHMHTEDTFYERISHLINL